MLEKVSKEQKQIFLLGDFNINLLNYNIHQPTNDFLDSLASNSIIPYILQPTRQDLTNNVDLSIEFFLNNMNSILDSNAPFKRVNKYKLRFKTKPWITLALQKSISVKNSLLNKFVKSKDTQALGKV